VTLRRRVGIIAAAAVGIAFIIAAFVSYFVVRGQLRGQIDDELRAEAAAVLQTGSLDAVAANLEIPPSAGGPAPYAQFVWPNGRVRGLVGDLVLPVTSGTLKAASSGNGRTSLADAQVGGSHLREITLSIGSPSGPTAAIQIARPLDGIDRILTHLRLVLLLLCAGGIGLALVLGRLAARRVLAPLAEVSATAELIGETDDLTQRLRVHADDEVGQLATRFNAMLESLQHSRLELDESVRAQRQLVADASHELRTPVTSLRTNVEVLLAGGELGDEDRRRLLADVVEQSEELTSLVADLIELARGDLPAGATDDVRLDGIVEEAIARAHRNSPNIEIRAELEPTIVEGAPERLHRAVNNLLDNAARHSPPAGPIEITVTTEGVRVRDHGTGLADEDLPYVFDRFYRGENSRGQQGSGLGLAIVRQVAEQHGGSVTAANAPDGGAVFTIHLPAVSAPSDDASERAASTRVSTPLF
jgi:two-component system, OmpR family, sensor histidine kinase MprB